MQKVYEPAKRLLILPLTKGNRELVKKHQLGHQVIGGQLYAAAPVPVHQELRPFIAKVAG